MSRRNLTTTEKLLIHRMLDLAGEPELGASLDAARVEEMRDGQMGSLRFLYCDNIQKGFGSDVVTVEGRDTDGVKLSISINVDTSGRLYELDVWKVNFAPLLCLPSPDTLSLVK